MRERTVTLMVLLGLVLAPGPAAADLGLWGSVQLWWARGSLESAKWWRDHYQAGAYGIGFMIADLNAAVADLKSDAPVAKVEIEQKAQVDFELGRVVAAGWVLKNRGALAQMKAKAESGGYSAYVKADVGARWITPFEAKLAHELFVATDAGKARARKQAASLYEEAIADWTRHLEHCVRSHRRQKLEVLELEERIAALERQERGGAPQAAAGPATPPQGEISILGVR